MLKSIAIPEHKPDRLVQADSGSAVEHHECYVKGSRSLFWDDQFLGVECCQDTLLIGDPWHGGHKQVSCPAYYQLCFSDSILGSTCIIDIFRVTGPPARQCERQLYSKARKKHLPLSRKMHAHAWDFLHVSVSISRQGYEMHCRCAAIMRAATSAASCKILPFKARGQEKGKVACLKCRPAFVAVYMAALAAGAAAGHFLPGMLVVALGMGAVSHPQEAGIERCETHSPLRINASSQPQRNQR